MKVVLGILGILMVLVGIAAGLFVGLYLCFYGGIVQIIGGISPVNAGAIAFGIIRVISAGLIGWLSALILIVPGAAMIIASGSKKDKNKK